MQPQACPANPLPASTEVASGSTIAVAMPFLTMLGAMAIVPAIRPMFAVNGAGEGAMHAFMSVNMLGAAIGAPLVSWGADRLGAHRRFALFLALADALLIGACALPLAVGPMLLVRTLQGAANVGVLSILMAMATRSPGQTSGTHSRLGAAGAAMTAAIALGPPLGGLLLGWGPRAPFFAAAVLNAVVALLVWTHARAPGPREPRIDRRAIVSRSPLLAVPMVLGFTERFTVGCFVVSFAIYAHEALGFTDRETSLRFTLFVAPFALAMYPMWKASERFSRAALMSAGGLFYGVSFLLLAVTRGAALDVTLILCGLASAMMYAPSLCYAGSLAPPGGRATSMALFNAAGCLGMMLGPAVAGILSAVLRDAGYGAAIRYPAIFAVAGVVQLVAMLALARPIAKLRAAERVAALPEQVHA